LITIEQYNPDLHEHIYELLLHMHGLDIQQAQDVPYLGYIAYCGFTPACMGWLRCMEGAAGIMDSFITNPELTAKDRHEAYNAVTEQIEATARAQGIKRLIAMSVDTGTIQRAKTHGYSEAAHKMLFKDLK